MAMIATASPRRPAPDLVLDTLREHAASLLGTARRYSICPDDAHDAYQRAVEIFLKRAHRLDRDGALPWLRTVVKHEALAVRAARQRLLGDVDLDARENREAATPEERAADADTLTRSAEALQRLKPQEVRALLLKAQGHSYKEIGELTGWSYTKVNRCLTEGRRRFLERYAAIESGAECERWTDVLSAIADGEAAAADLLAVRPHLRNCPACRARIRDFQGVPRALGALVPAALALHDVPGAAHHAAPRALGRAYDAVIAGLPERVVASAQRVHAGLEAASTGKLAAVAMSATALGGGVAAVDGPSERLRHRAAPRPRAVAHARPVSARTRVVSASLSDRRRPTPDTPVASARARSATPSPSPASRAGRARGASEFGFEGGGGAPASGAKSAAASTAGDEFGGGGGGGGTVATADAAPAAGGEFGP
jgi:RNA polymerase sigma factor (sigma-70 family)